MKKLLRTLAIVLCLSMITPTAANPLVEKVEAATKIKLNYKTKTIYEGQSFRLKISGTKKKVKWSSANKKIATVSSKGLVKGKDGGKTKRTVKITATVSGKKYVCKVTVKAPKVDTDDNDDSDDYDDDSSDDSDISDNPSQRSAAENIAILKDYIQHNGYTNTYGNKVINYKDRYNGDEYLFAIVYEKSTDILTFLTSADMKVSGGTTECVTTMDMVSADNSAVLYPEHICVLTSYGYGDAFSASAQINPGTYTADSDIYFHLMSDDSILNESDIQSLSNTLMRFAFVGWNHILVQNLNMSLKDIGFVSYE